MILADSKIISPNNWYHSPTLKDDLGRTVAMFLAWNSIIPPDNW